MKFRVAWRNLKNYVRHDLKEIAFPSSLPNPPGYKTGPQLRKATFKDIVEVLRISSKLYVRSWSREGLSKDDWRKAGIVDEDDTKPAPKEPTEPSAIEELALATRAGAEHVRPALQRLYMTRATAYRDALKSFVQGYQEGIAEVMAPTGSSKKPEELKRAQGQ